MSGDPRLLLGIALAAIAIAASAPRPGGALAVGALALAASVRRGRPRARLLAAPALLGLVAAVSAGGAGRGLAVFSRVLACGGVAAWLAAALPVRALLAALTWARCPRALCELLALAERQVDAIGAAAAGVREAQRARLGYEGVGDAVRSAGVLAGALTGRAVDHATAIAECLAIRGEPGVEALPPLRWDGVRDSAWAAAAAVAIAGCAAVGWGTW